MNNLGISIPVPESLPLLESLCWNIKDPYSLSLETMLSIYEERWHQKDILGRLNIEERNFISEISDLFNGLPLIDMNNSKDEISVGIQKVISQLDIELLNRHRVVLGGGALIGLLHELPRYSSDIDFLVEPQNYRALSYILRKGESIFISQKDLEINIPRVDRYGIRYPIKFRHNGKTIALKLEIVAEHNLSIGNPQKVNNIPCLNFIDRIVSKLIANVDRGLDKSKYSRDLIDLAIIGAHSKIPIEAIIKAKNIYPDTLDYLKETIEIFQSNEQYRDECYEVLQIERPEVIINGVDYLAEKCLLLPTQRTFKETDFSYLDSD